MGRILGGERSSEKTVQKKARSSWPVGATTRVAAEKSSLIYWGKNNWGRIFLARKRGSNNILIDAANTLKTVFHVAFRKRGLRQKKKGNTI